jgi:histidyl-tRNA synthetase
MLKALRGTKDILPGEIEIWQSIENSARDIFSIYGYREIRTPIIEDVSLFIRSIGGTTDIVQKEMYAFSDKGARNIALRPEATASVVRAYLENFGGQTSKVKKFFYIGPMFRAERPQKGRQRQFHQLGVELIGSDEPFRDAEVIFLAIKFLHKIGIYKDDIALKINSLGCQKDKLDTMHRYKETVKPFLKSLCDECKSRYNKNVLRIFDCKNSECNKIVKGINPEGPLCADCSQHFTMVKKYLDEWGINYTVDSKIVRGLDYYTKTVFEIVHKKLGAQDAICAGGRYNSLIEDMGGKSTPAIGFAFGIERLILAIEGEPPYRMDKKLDLFIVTTGEALHNEAFKLLNYLRCNSRYSCDVFFEEDSLKAQMKQAQRKGAKFVIIFGDEEFKRKKVLFKNMDTGEQEEVEHNEGVILKKIEEKIK